MGKHVMLDLETFGTLPGYAPRSIGAVAYDPVTGTLGETFYANIDRASCEALGLKVDPATEAWWADQGDAARSVLEPNQIPVVDVITAFADYYKATGAKRVWAHGATFDPPFLESIYRAAALTPPWRYADARDTRTIYELADVQPDRTKGVHHYALDDALNQAEAVIEAYRKLRISRRSLARRIADAFDAFRQAAV